MTNIKNEGNGEFDTVDYALLIFKKWKGIMDRHKAGNNWI